MIPGVLLARIARPTATAALVIVGLSAGAMLPRWVAPQRLVAAARQAAVRPVRLPPVVVESAAAGPRNYLLVSGTQRVEWLAPGISAMERLPPVLPRVFDFSMTACDLPPAPRVSDLPAPAARDMTVSVLKARSGESLSGALRESSATLGAPVGRSDIVESLEPSGKVRDSLAAEEGPELNAASSQVPPRPTEDLAPKAGTDFPPANELLRGDGILAVMAPTTELAQREIRQAIGLANRGAIYAARLRLEGALHEISQALDAQRGTQSHNEHLGAGLLALREIADFLPPVGGIPSQMNVAQILQRHRSSIVSAREPRPPTSAEAIRRYCEFAADELHAAVGPIPAASEALYALGKLSMIQAEHSSSAKRAHLLTANTYFRAALRVNDRMYLAANELAVLLARDGKLAEARDLLQGSLAVQPLPITWHNLSVVHQRLGDVRLAERSLMQWRLASARQHGAGNQRTTAGNGTSVYWVDKSTFERGSLGVQR